MKLKKGIAFALIFLLILDLLNNITVFAGNLHSNLITNVKASAIDVASNSIAEIPTLLETGFLAIGVKDSTKVLTNQYVAKNGFKYVKDGVYYTTSAFDFHIFSREAILNAHTNGNIATKALFANGAGFGTNQSRDLGLKEENFFLNSVDGISNIASDGNIMIGTNIPTELVDNNNSLQIGTNANKLGIDQSSRVYKQTIESVNYIDIDSELENLKNISSLFSKHITSQGVTLSVPNGENQIIILDGGLANTYNNYLNIKASDISDGSNKRVLNIVIPAGKTLIINVDMAGVNINYLQSLYTKINNHSNSEDVVRNENNILWNLYDSSASDGLFATGMEYAKVGMSDYFMGTILAPNANIQYGAVNGSIIANKTKQNYQESHKWDFTGHSREDASANLEVRKILEGLDLEEGMFSFELLDKDNNVLQTVSNRANGSVQFATITYNTVGTYEYKVREVKGNLDGIIYDESVLQITVYVIDDGDGKLVATVVYPENGVYFTNTYQEKTTSAVIEATKTLTGKELVAGMFTFELQDVEGTVLQAASNNGDGTVRFSAITYDAIGTYQYKLKEVSGNLGGVIYDESIYDVTVNVTDTDGKLVASVVYPENKIEFINNYEIESTSANLEATKTLIGKELVAGMFTFELQDVEGKVLQTVKNSGDGKVEFSTLNFDEVGTYTYKIVEVNDGFDGIIYDAQGVDVSIIVTDKGEGQLRAEITYPNKRPEFTNRYQSGSTSAVIEATKSLIGRELVAGMFTFELLDQEGNVLQTTGNSADGIIQFATISYDSIGSYQYKIRERKESLVGVTYDESLYSVTVNVTDTGEGKLVATIVYPDNRIVFTNSYQSSSISAIIEATKTLTGKKLAADMFNFKLLDKEDNVLQTVKNSADGTIKFNTLNFEKAGTYAYKIVEVNDGLGGITYDPQEVDVTIIVTDNGEGQLRAEVSYPNKKPEFTNSYQTGSTSASIEATKKLTGKELAAGMFTFELLDQENNVLQTTVNRADGTVQFETINYDSVGAYQYKVREVKESLAGVTYDLRIFSVTVNVTDTGEGKLAATVVYPDNKIVFNNSYGSNPTSASIEATKTFTGKDLVAGMFTFELLDKEGNVLQTAKNSADGTIQFATISYDSIGSYQYKIRERKESLVGVTYDESLYSVTVNVTDAGEGKLVATVVYPNNKIVFTNSYQSSSTSAAIEATKKLTGKDLVAGMFQFELLDMEGKVLQTISNRADGVVQFAAINYNTIGTYEYKVREVKGSLDRVTYDLRVFDVTVNVTEAGVGKLIANIVYPINKIQFINHYEAISENNSIYVNLEATKILTGKDLAAGMFSFQLLDDRGNLIETVKNSLDGKIKFKTLHYYSAGTYSYKMVEVNDGLSGITYDSQVVDVTITVTENGTGQLEAAVKYPNKKPEFTNNYQSGTTSAVIEVTKKLIGKDLASGMFTFELLDSKGNVIQTVSNSSDGKVQFAAISYDRTGTYEYKVREVKGSFNEIIYDESIYDITVSVTDKGNGGLISTVSYPEGKVVFKNNIIQGSLEITKTDAVTGEPLANAEFTIRNAIGSVVALGKTDENGNVVFEGLFYGKYTYEETAVPEGYLIDNNKYPFEIVNQNEVVMVVMHNERKSAGPETPLDPEKPDNTVEQSIPKTGEPGVGKAIMIVLLGVGGLIITTRKKRIIKGKIG